MFLFTVEDKFMITGRGLTLTPGLGDIRARTGDKIKLIQPDGSVIQTTIQGIQIFGSKTSPISIGHNFTKDDVPIGTEVWLDEKA